MNFELGPAGEAAMRLVFTEVPQPSLTKALIEIENRARQHFGSTLTDSVIGYTTLTLFFSASTLERDRTQAWLSEQAEAIVLMDHPTPEHSTTDVVLPVLYHPSVAPDLEWIADDRGLGIDDVIALHTEATYFAYATGFAPGFCYLGTPRHYKRRDSIHPERQSPPGRSPLPMRKPRSIPATHLGDGGSSAPVPSRFLT